MNTTHKKMWIFTGIVVLIVGSIITFYSLRSSPIVNIHSDGQTIIAFGDSLFQGVGATKNNDLVTKIAGTIDEPIINMGVSGDTTAIALLRVDDAIALHPKIVIILLGGNDFLRRVPINETFTNLDAIVTKFQSNGAVVLLLGVKGGILGDPFAERFESFAKEHGTAFVPNVLDGLIGNSKYMTQDQIHPNDAGYELIAQKVTPVLKDMIKENKK